MTGVRTRGLLWDAEHTEVAELEGADLRKVVSVVGIDDDLAAVDGADLTLSLVAVLVADGLVRLTARLGIEPAGEGPSLHQAPLAPRELDVSAANELGSLDDVGLGLLHPSVVPLAEVGLAAVDAVGAVDHVDVARPVAAEVLVPADAVGASDGVGRLVHGVRVVLAVGEDLLVEDVTVPPGAAVVRSGDLAQIIHGVLLGVGSLRCPKTR